MPVQKKQNKTSSAPVRRPRRKPTAYDDQQFMHSPICRGIRLELEYLKPAVTMDVHGINSTVTIFGSARIKPPEEAAAILKQAENEAAADPKSRKAKSALASAKKVLELSKYYDMARDFAARVSEYSGKMKTDGKSLVVMTGGGPGIMEAANRGACDKKCKSVGLRIDLPFEEKTNPYIPDEFNFKFHYFCIRKMHFTVRTKAVACFPGGFGTLDEIFETLTLIQNNIIPKIPILLFGSDFWKKTINWQLLVDEGMISAEDLQLFKFCDSANDGLKEIKKFYGLR